MYGTTCMMHGSTMCVCVHDTCTSCVSGSDSFTHRLSSPYNWRCTDEHKHEHIHSSIYTHLELYMLCQHHEHICDIREWRDTSCDGTRSSTDARTHRYSRAGESHAMSCHVMLRFDAYVYYMSLVACSMSHVPCPTCLCLACQLARCPSTQRQHHTSTTRMSATQRRGVTCTNTCSSCIISITINSSIT